MKRSRERRLRGALPLVALALAASVARAGDVRLELRVTSVAGSAVYVDVGASGGLALGDRVRFRLASGTLATGIVRATTGNGARVELDAGSERPAVGARGEATVPDSRPGARAASADPAAPDAAPAHPPWSHPPESWSADQPLLAPAFAIAPEDRERELHGRAWLRFDGTEDVAGDRRWGLAAIGSDVTLENPFGDGGALRIDAEAFARTSDVAADDGLHDYDDARVRLDRLVYRVGGTADRPDELLVGRFLEESFPELGVLDGLGWNHVTRSGSEYGASFGYLPEPFPDRASFEDLEASVHYRHAFDPARRAQLGVAYQSTWHSGEADRSLFVADAELHPSDRFALRATTSVDLYDSSDEIKGPGPELTEARVSATWTTADGSGLDAFALERRIPELLRDEFLARRADDVANSVLDRVGLRGWTDLGARTRLDARVSRWSDEDDDGIEGEVGATYREPFGAQSSISGALLWADGSYSSGPGARIQASDVLGTTAVGLGWQSFWYDQKDYGGDDSALSQHSLFGSVDVPLSDRWDLSFVVDRSIGDELDSWTVGFLLQTHF